MMGNMRKSLESKILGLYKSKSTWKENEHLEFKSGERGLPNSLWETYSAFANTSGGIIIVGVRDNGTIEGISQSDKRLQDFTNNINNPGKCSINLCNAAIITIDEKEVLAIEVSPATPEQKLVSSKELREYFPLHQADMGKILSKLRDEGYLQDSGKSNAKKYCLADKLGQEVAKAYSETHFMAPKNEFMAPRDDFMAPKDDFMAPKIPSAASEGPTLSAHERVIRELGIPSQLEGQIEEYRGTTRQNPKVTMSLILDICRTRWVTALQLSILLNREVRPLRKNFLQPAILCRKLEHLHPASPKNKHQAYRTVE